VRRAGEASRVKGGVGSMLCGGLAWVMALGRGAVVGGLAIAVSILSWFRLRSYGKGIVRCTNDCVRLLYW